MTDAAAAEPLPPAEGQSDTVVVLATRNEGKIRELAAILTGTHPRGEPSPRTPLTGVTLVGLGDFPDAPEVPETGATFEENALIKARAIAAHTGLPSVADDSGLCVDALNGMPGVLSARWSGRHGDDKANLDLVLAQISDTPDSRRGAHFACAAALAVPVLPEVPGSPIETFMEHVVTGKMTGRLVREPRGSGGFGYDPIFVPDGYDITTAEMSAEAKNTISHRGKAFRALAPLIRRISSETVALAHDSAGTGRHRP